MLKGITTIIFDLGGVVLNLDYGKSILAFEESSGIKFDELYSQAKQNQLFDLFEEGKISRKQFRTELKSNLNLSVSDADFDASWNAMLLDLPKERIGLLQELSGRFKILLFSNTNEIHYDAFRKILTNSYGNSNLLEDTFHKTYYSHLIGERKPNEQAFRHILTDQNLVPAEVLFIDDSEQHILGARSIGIKAIHLRDMDIVHLFKQAQ